MFRRAHDIPAYALLTVLMTVHAGCFASSPSEMELYPTMGAEGTVITMSGAEFITSPTMYCRIGKRIVLARQVIIATSYESIILCKAPQQSAGFHSVEITHNGRDFSNSGLLFHYVDIFVSKVYPEHVDRTGGTTVMVQGRGFRNGCHCNSGGDAVEAAFASSALLTCELLAASDDKDSMSPLSISAAHTRPVHSQPYNLQLADALHIKEIRAGTQAEELLIEGKGFNPRVQQLWCKIGSISVLGQIFSSTRCMCILPYTRVGNYPLQISNNQVDFSTAVNDVVSQRQCAFDEHPVPTVLRSEGTISFLSSYEKKSCSIGGTTDMAKVHAQISEGLAEFRCSAATFKMAFETVEIVGSAWCAGNKHLVEVIPEPVPLVVFPDSVVETGGSLHSVFGRDFAEKTMCKFGDSLNHGERISSALAICEAPGAFPGQTKYTNIGNEINLVNYPIVRDASPMLGFTQGGSSLQFTAKFNTRAHIFACQISSISKVVARWLSSDKIECITPARNCGQVDIFISTGPFLEAWNTPFTYGLDLHSDDDVQHLRDKVSITGYANQSQAGSVSTREMERKVQPTIMRFLPPIIGASGGVVTVYGDGFSQGTCLNQGVSTCRLVSSALIRMEVNGGVSGEYFTPLALLSTSSSQAVRLMYEDEALAISVTPVHGTVDGGTVMSIAGESFINSLRLSCTIGTTTPVSGRWIDSRMMECISSAHEKGFLDISVRNGSPGRYGRTILYHYRASYAVSTDALEASHSELATIEKATSDYQNREPDVPGMTQISRVMCGTPLNDVGVVAAAMCVSGHLEHGDSEVQIISAALVWSIIPMHIESGTHHPVKIIGKGFSMDSSFCMVDGKVLDALILSSAVAICELPDRADGDVNVVVGRNIGSGNAGMVTYFRQTRVMEVIPSSGSEAGGTLVVVKTLTDQRSPAQCRFGTTGPVATRASSAVALECTSPSHLASISVFTRQMRHSIFSDIHNSFSFFFLRIPYYLYSLPQSLPLNGGSVRLFSSDRCSSIISHCGIFSLRHDCFLETTFLSTRSSGFTTVKLCNYSSVDLYFSEQSSIEHIFPRTAIPNSPHPYSVYGHDFSVYNTSVLIDSTEIQCKFRSSCMLTCTSILSAASKVGIRHRLSLDQTELSLETYGIKVVSMEQKYGVSIGGSVIGIFGTFHADHPMTMCRVGSIAPITVSRVNNDVVECITPAHIIGVVAVSVGFLGDGYVLESQKFTYMTTFALRGVIPSKGTTREDVEVALHKTSCGPKDAIYEGIKKIPRFGNDLTNALRCTMAASNPGIVAWETVRSVDLDPAQVVFEYFSPSLLKSVQPKHVSPSGGALVFLSGTHFMDGLGCEFDGTFVPGLFVTSGIFICEAPAFGTQLLTATVIITSAGAATASTVLELSLIFPSAVESVNPNVGSSDGGTIVVAGTQDKPVKNGLSIAVGNISPIAYRYLNRHVLDYVSPAHCPGKSLVKISSSQGDHCSAGKMYEHVASNLLCTCSPKCARTWGTIDALLQSENAMKMTTVCMIGSRCSNFEWDATQDCDTYYSRNEFAELHSVIWSMVEDSDQIQAGSVSSREMERKVQPKILRFFPPIIGASGGVVTVYGDGFSQGTCLNQGVSTCQLVSSALIRMEVNGGVSGEYFTPLALLSTSSSQAVRLMYEDEALAISVTPIHGTVDGGTVMSVAGESFINSLRLSCTIGTTTPVSGRWIDSRMMECISPAHEKGILDISVRNGSPGRDGRTILYHYRASYAVSTDALEASHSELATIEKATSDYQDREPDVPGMTQISRVMCGTPLNDVGVVAAAVCVSGHLEHVDSQVQIISAALVRSIIPMHIESGTHHPVKIIGKGFSMDSSFCMVDGKVLDALILSSAVAICELPDRADGDVNVVVGRNIGSGNAGMVTYFRQARVMEVIPSSGSEAGGTLVVVKTLTDQRSPAQCRFGTTGPVATRASLSAAHECTSPSHPARSVPLSLSTTPVGIGSHSLFSFFVASPLLDAISPRTSHVPVCPPMDLGFDNVLRGIAAIFYDFKSRAICKLQSAASGFMAVFVMSATTLHPSLQFTTFEILVSGAPFVHSLHPSLGIAAGGTLTQVTGENMVGNEWNHLSCVFGNETRKAHTVSSSISVCEVPSGNHLMNGFVNVELTRELSSSVVRVEEAVQYAYVDSPSLEYISPERGPSRGGTALHLHGLRFSNTQDLSCKFGNMHVRATFVSDQEILCLTPSHAYGGVAVHVATNGRDYTMNRLLFSFSS